MGKSNLNSSTSVPPYQFITGASWLISVMLQYLNSLDIVVETSNAQICNYWISSSQGTWLLIPCHASIVVSAGPNGSHDHH